VQDFIQEAWNDRNDQAVLEYVSEDIQEHGLTGMEPIALNLGEYLKYRADFLRAFPDVHFAVDQVMVEGDRTAVRYHVTGTHLGDGIGCSPTGRHIDYTAMFIGIWRDGKLVEAWNNYDQLGMMRQLGLIE
jgi:predicted ester cyclase